MNNNKIINLATKHAKEFIEASDRIAHYGHVGNVFKNEEQASLYRQTAWDRVDWMPRTEIKVRQFPTKRAIVVVGMVGLVAYTQGWDKPLTDKVKQQFRKIQLRRNAPKDPWAEPPNTEAASQ